MTTVVTQGADQSAAQAATHARRTSGRRLPWLRWLPWLLVLLVVLASAVLTLGRAVVAGEDGSPRASGSAAAGDNGDRLGEALAELRRWDVLRATAYASGDPQRLHALYVDGSAAAAADVDILESYAARGLVVDRMRTQVLAAEPVRLEDDRFTLRVRDRLVGAEAVDEAGRRIALPRDEVSTRLLTLVRVGQEWRMQEVGQE